jgi:hypothetical protein
MILSHDQWQLVDNTSPGYVGGRRDQLWAERMQNTAKEIGKRFGSWKAIILNTGRPVVSAKTLTFEYLRNPELLEFLFGSWPLMFMTTIPVMWSRVWIIQNGAS